MLFRSHIPFGICADKLLFTSSFHRHDHLTTDFTASDDLPGIVLFCLDDIKAYLGPGIGFALSIVPLWVLLLIK